MKVSLNHQLSDPYIQGVEILSIGTELLLGNIVNTNAQWISEELTSLSSSDSLLKSSILANLSTNQMLKHPLIQDYPLL